MLNLMVFTRFMIKMGTAWLWVWAVILEETPSQNTPPWILSKEWGKEKRKKINRMFAHTSRLRREIKATGLYSKRNMGIIMRSSSSRTFLDRAWQSSTRMIWTREWEKGSLCWWLRVHSILKIFPTGPLKMTTLSAPMTSFTKLMTATIGTKKNGRDHFNFKTLCQLTVVKKNVKNVKIIKIAFLWVQSWPL